MAVSGSEDKTVMLWNPFSCRPLGTLTGHAAGIVAMAVNEKESQILTAATDKTIKVRSGMDSPVHSMLTVVYPSDPSSCLALLTNCSVYYTRKFSAHNESNDQT